MYDPETWKAFACTQSPSITHTHTETVSGFCKLMTNKFMIWENRINATDLQIGETALCGIRSVGRLVVCGVPLPRGHSRYVTLGLND